MTTLDAAYAECRSVTKRSGTTYYWSTFVLPPVKRHHVWALYALCRNADDIVDVLDDRPAAERAAALADFGDALRDGLDAGRADDAVLHAVVHTARAFGIDPACFDRFLRSMTMDLTVSSLRHVGRPARLHGRLGRGDRRDDAADPRAGVAGGACRTPATSASPSSSPTSCATSPRTSTAAGCTCRRRTSPASAPTRARRQVDDAWVALMRFEIARCRALYESADLGIAMLPPASARCVRTARVLYSGILERIERSGYDVFAERVRVPTARKALTAVSAMRPG